MITPIRGGFSNHLPSWPLIIYSPLPLDGADSFRRLLAHREASNHADIKTRKLVVCTTRYSLIHNHALSGHLVYHKLARWVGKLSDVVAILPLPSNGPKYFRSRWRAHENKMDVLFLTETPWGFPTILCALDNVTTSVGSGYRPSQSKSGKWADLLSLSHLTVNSLNGRKRVEILVKY